MPELFRLDSFLHSQHSGEGAMSLSATHGFLTAVASGPEALEPGEWIRLVFDDPVFQDGDQAQEILTLILRLYKDILLCLPVEGRFRPLIEFVADGDGSHSQRAEEWCRGYLSALILWGDRPALGVDRLLEPLFLIAKPQGPQQQAVRAAHYDELCALLPQAAEAVYRYWHPG